MATSSRSNEAGQGGVPDAERRPIHVRAYAEPPKTRDGRGREKPNHWVLVFDTETFPNEAQRFRFGSFQFRAGGALKWQGLFYDPDAVDDVELAELQAFQRDHQARRPGQKVKLFTKKEWIERIFFKAAYSTNATIVGFNLPFDISRLAVKHDTARAVRRRDKTVDRSMVGGFTFKLSWRDSRPHVRVKQLSRKAAFINFASPAQSSEGSAVKRGHFVDIKTLGDALTGEAFSLGSLAKHLGVAPKGKFDDFARKIDREFIEYAMDDAEVTWQCYERLKERYDEHPLKATPPTRIYSGASLGKAYLETMNVKPWVQAQPGFDPAMIGAIMSTYYGGRAEVHRRRDIVRTLYCDFAAMYPTVCTLMGLWRYVIAEGIDERDATAEVRDLLSRITVADLQDKAIWAQLQTIVQLRPDADIFPVRTEYGREPFATIGVNYLSADRPLWFTLADCIASKLLTGKTPEVVRAVHFSAKEVQPDLEAVNIAGRKDFRVDPSKEDFYQRLVDLRREVKVAQKAAADKAEADRLEAEQLALKIIANATAYGIFIELNVEDADGKEAISIFGPDGALATETAKREQRGRFFHPLLATVICGAARLMLAITERHLTDAGLDWALCDTDSMAFAMPDGMDPTEFERRVETICAWFDPLNCYAEKGPILEIEKQNFSSGPGGDGRRRYQPLYCLAISAKRYALFNEGEDGQIVIRKASAHGLGHLKEPYGEPPASDQGDNPTGLLESGVRRWQEDVWKAIIAAVRSPTPRDMESRLPVAFKQPAASRHAISKPELMKGFALYNEGLEEADQVGPFSFMLWLHAKKRHDKHAENPEEPWDPRARELKPAAAYVKYLADLGRVFDRETGEDIDPEDLQTYADILRSYHLHPEAKFHGGSHTGRGVLRRRHIFADALVHIGKEADQFEEIEEFGIDRDDPTIVYCTSGLDRESMLDAIASANVRRLKAEARVGHKLVQRAQDRDPKLALGVILKLYRAVQRLELSHRGEILREQLLIETLKSAISKYSLVKLHRRGTPDLHPRGTPSFLRFERRCAEPWRSAAQRRGVRRLRFSRPGGGLGEVEQAVGS